MIFYGSKTLVVQFVSDLILHLKPDSVSITITTRGSSEDYSVSIVTDTSLESIVLGRANFFCLMHMNT
jgi:hypothetical protein